MLVGGLEHVLFSPIAGMVIQSDFHIFRRGRYITNQYEQLIFHRKKTWGYAAKPGGFLPAGALKVKSHQHMTLVGGLEHDLFSHIQLGISIHPNWRTHRLSIQLGISIHPNWRIPSFFRGVGILYHPENDKQFFPEHVFNKLEKTQKWCCCIGFMPKTRDYVQHFQGRAATEMDIFGWESMESMARSLWWYKKRHGKWPLK